LSCWKHKFSNHRDAEFWGPSYQCQQCGWWHISYRDRRIAWERLVILGVCILAGWGIVWPLVRALMRWNWP